MTGAEQLRALLGPLGVYKWENSFQAAEIYAVGDAVDKALVLADITTREAVLATAVDIGLSRFCQLLPGIPAAPSPVFLRNAIAALLRIGDASFTLQAVSDNVSGCGLPALVRETDQPGEVEVSFPGIPGIPPNFSAIRPLVEDIVPAHLDIIYYFWYLTWQRLEAVLPTWQTIDDKRFSWHEFECFIDGSLL